MSEALQAYLNGLAKRIRREWAPIFLALLITVGFFLVMNHLAAHTIPDGNREAFLSMIDTLKTVWILAMGFFFGSTASNQRKDEIIAKAGPVDTQ